MFNFIDNDINRQVVNDFSFNDDTMMPTRQRGYFGPNLNRIINEPDHENPIESTEVGLNRLENSIQRIVKQAGDFGDVAQGSLVGGITGGLLGVAGLAALRTKGIKNLAGLVGLNSNPILKDFVAETANEAIKSHELYKKALKKVVPTTAIGGAIVGSTVGALSKNKQQPDYQEQYSPYSDGYYKQASEQHAFITETNVEPLPGANLPDDIRDAVMLEHPALKYVPISSALSSGAAFAIYNKLKHGEINPSTANTLMAAFGGLTAGTLAKREAEKHYSKPYMDKYSEQINNRYLNKKANGGADGANEFISDTGIPIIESKIGPHKLESVILHEHPSLDNLPILGTASGLLLGRMANPSMTGMVTGTAIGSGLGTLARMAALEHYMNPYRKPFIDEVKQKYNIKSANILGAAVGKVNKLVNENPIADVVNYYGLAKDLGKPAWNWAKKKNIGGIAKHLTGIENQVKSTLDNNPKLKSFAQKADKAMDFGFNKVQLPVGMLSLGLSATGIGGSKELDAAQEVAGFQNRMKKTFLPPKYNGQLGDLYKVASIKE